MPPFNWDVLEGKKASFAVANRLNESAVEAVQDHGMTFQRVNCQQIN
jgi:hypothetical protein